jgi:iron complex outermembrane receptor protein
VLNITACADIEFQSDNRIEYVNLGLPAEMVSSIEPSEIFDNIRYGDKLLDQKENVLGIGPFVQGDFNISPITFLLGLRYDNYKFSVDDNFMEDGVDDSGERMMEKFSPFAGINFRIDALTKLFFNYSTSFQTPTTTELSNREDGQGGFNPDLLPEEIYSFETGFLRYGLIKNFNLNVSAFYMNFTNMLIPYQVSVSEEIFFANAGNAENKGVEVILEYSPIKNVVTSLSYSGYAFKFTDYLVEYEENQYIQLAGKKVPGIPANKIAAALNYQTDSGLFSTIRLLWNDKYYTNDFNGPPPGVDAPQSNFINESYFDIDFRLGYLLNTQLLNIEVFLGMNNILDEKYNGSIVPNAVAFRYFEPSAERNFYGGVKLFFPGTASSQY